MARLINFSKLNVFNLSKLSEIFILVIFFALSLFFNLNDNQATVSAVSEPAENIVAVSNVKKISKSFSAKEKEPDSTVPSTSNEVNSTVNTTNTAAVTYSQSAMDPGVPTYIQIGGYVSSSINKIGLTAGGAVDVPNSTVGWWDGSSEPNTIGAVFLDGHNPGVLSGLVNVPIGAIINITMGDGSIVNYKVIDIKVYKYTDPQIMIEALTPRGGSYGLNLMTCYGQVVNGTYSERYVVYSQQI